MDPDRLLRELSDFLRIPSMSTNASHDADCRAAAEWVAGELRRLGCRDVQFLASDTHPVVWGVGPEVPGAPTLLVYGHYDVQPPDPLDEWTTLPFEPTVRGGKLFARGAADDKGQAFCLLKAIEANGTPRRPPVNFRFLIEGEEEYGSRVLFELLRREPERTRADAVLIADMAYVAPRWPAVYTTLRGLCYAEITVRTAKSDLHSGEFGGAAPNAHEELARLLGRLKTPDGKVHVPGLYTAVRRPSKRELATWKRLPFKESEFLKHRVQAKALTGLKAYSVLDRLWALPTFEIHGITGGVTGDGAQTGVPALGPPQGGLRRPSGPKAPGRGGAPPAAGEGLPPQAAPARVRLLHGADPATVAVTHPAFQLLDRAFKEVVGRGLVPARAGGSIPVVPALGKSGAPVILTGIGLPDDRLHAPNEKLDLKQLWDGIRVFSRFYDLLGAKDV